MRKYLEPGIAYKEAGAKKTFRKLRHQVSDWLVFRLYVRTFQSFTVLTQFEIIIILFLQFLIESYFKALFHLLQTK